MHYRELGPLQGRRTSNDDHFDWHHNGPHSPPIDFGMVPASSSDAPSQVTRREAWHCTVNADLPNRLHRRIAH